MTALIVFLLQYGITALFIWCITWSRARDARVAYGYTLKPKGHLKIFLSAILWPVTIVSNIKSETKGRQ